MRAENGARIRHAVSFDKALHSYIEQIARERGEAFSSVCASMLREIMHDDMTVEAQAVIN